MLKSKPALKRILAVAFCAGLGALLSHCEIISFPAPFAAALPAILPTVFGVAALFGTLIGGVLGLSAELIPVAAASAAALLSRLKTNGSSSKRAIATTAAFSSLTYLMSTAALSAFSGGGLTDLLRACVFAAVLFGVTYVFSELSVAIRSARGLSAVAVFFSCGALTCALSSLNIGPISLGGIAAVYFVLHSAVRFGPAQAAVMSTVCALGAGICSPTQFSAFAILCIPAVICGFIFYGSPVKAAGLLVLSFAPLAVVFGVSDSALELLLDCAVSSLIFVISYRRTGKYITQLLPQSMPINRKYRSEALRSTLSDISERLISFSEKPAAESRPLSDVVYSKVCMGCQNNSDCFEEKSARNSLSELDKLNPLPDLTDICRALPCCSRIAEVKRVSLEAGRRSRYISEKSSEHRSSLRLCAQMLSAAEELIADAESAALKTVQADKLLSRCLSLALKKSGIRPSDCAIFRSGAAEITLPASARINEVRIAAEASEISGTEYSRPERLVVGDSVILRYEPKPEYSVEIGACQLPAGREASGDVAETFVSGAYSYAILSDGMGIGAEARTMALMLVNILRELLCAGFSVGTAVSLSSLILMSSAPEESFATLDILRVNIHTGAAEIYKAGGCQSYLIVDGSESMLRAGGYPVGILDRCDLKVHRFFVRDSAALVMMTDGALNINSADCSKTVGGGFKLPSTELAAMLVQGTHPEKTEHRDDISVAVVKIERKAV